MSSPEEQFAEALLFGWPMNQVPRELARKVKACLVAKKNQAIKDRDYRRVQLIENTINGLDKTGAQMKQIERSNMHAKMLNEKLEKAKDDLRQAIAKHERIADRFNEERNNAMLQQEQEHEAELYKFDEEHNIEPPAKFRKFSREYWQLKTQEEFLISSKRYVEANALRAEANKLEKEERRKQKENWELYVQQQREKLIQKHDAARKYLLEKWQKEWDGLLISFDKDEQQHRKTVLAIESTMKAGEQLDGSTTGLPRLTSGTQSSNVTGRKSTARSMIRSQGRSVSRGSVVKKGRM